MSETKEIKLAASTENEAASVERDDHSGAVKEESEKIAEGERADDLRSNVDLSDAPNSDKPVRTSSSEVDWTDWASQRRRVGQAGRNELLGAHRKLKRALAMAAIEVVHRVGHDWMAEADDLDLDVPKSDHPFMAHVVVTFGGASSDDAKAKQDLAKFRDRHALALQWLVSRLRGDPLRFSALEEGINAAIALLDDQEGGIAAFAKEQRITNATVKKGRNPPTHKAIALDPSSVRDVRISRARNKVEEKAGGSELRLGFVYEVEGEAKVAVTIDPNDAQVEEALLRVNVVEPLVDQIGELSQTSAMVTIEPTDIPRRELDDPENPEGGVRQTYHHAVFCGDKVVISPIMTPAGVVVFAKPFIPVLPSDPGQLCHFRTQQWRIMEANLADPTRRPVFSGDWGEVGDVGGLFRFVATTEAAEGEGIAKISVLVEPLQSAAGNFPLNAHLDRFKPQFTGTMRVRAWKARNAEFVAKAIKSKKGEKVEHQFRPASWKVVAKKKDDERDLRGDGTATVAMMPADFIAVSNTIAELPVQGDIGVKADRNAGVVFSFRTHLFEYEVIVPARTPDGARNATLFRPFLVNEE
ncbi:MAG: hypothetical protein VYD57_03010 [Pseudomonadota bacterium]|nr:hypothetical protein [Pseudomonadota bacterium]